jgi:hypothetical protein
MSEVHSYYSDKNLLSIGCDAHQRVDQVEISLTQSVDAPHTLSSFVMVLRTQARLQHHRLSPSGGDASR